jgi:DNA-binding NarL/FixJ family response regulator
VPFVTFEPLRRDFVATRPAGVPHQGPHDARQPMCIVVGEIGDGEGDGLVRTLHRRGLPRVVVLARRARDTEILALLAGGVRGVVVGETDAVPAEAVPPPREETRARNDLSDREIEVLQRVADGHSNREIGAELGLSALTVKSHLARISRKLGTGDRAQLVAIAIRADLLG